MCHVAGRKKYTQFSLALIMHKIAKQSCVLKLSFTTCHGINKFTGERPWGPMMLTYSGFFDMQEEEQEAQCCPTNGKVQYIDCWYAHKSTCVAFMCVISKTAVLHAPFTL